MGCKVTADTMADTTLKEVRGPQINVRKRYFDEVEVKAGKTQTMDAFLYRDRLKYTGEVSSFEIHCRGIFTGKKIDSADFLKFRSITIREREIPSPPEGPVQYEYDLDYAERRNIWCCILF